MEQEVVSFLRGKITQENFTQAHKAMRRRLESFSRSSFFHIPGFTEADMQQELLTTMFLAVQTYDPTKGRTFNTFLQMCWRNRIGTLRRAAGSQSRSATIISLDSGALNQALQDRLMDSVALPSAEDWACARETVREEWESASEVTRRRAVG